MPAINLDFSRRPAEWISQTASLRDEPVSLPANGDNLTTARILCSLGVPIALNLSIEPVDWDALGDLLAYAVYGRCPHAPIEPFETWIEQPPPDPEKLNDQFINRDPCVHCPGWRACHGEWKAQCNPACRDFFTEILDARVYRRQQTGGTPCPR